MIDLTDLKNTLNVQLAFRLNEPQEYVGDIENTNNVLERIKLVLTQTFDALDIPPFKQFVIFGEGRTILILHYQNEVIGVVFDEKVDVEEVRRYIYKKSGVIKTEEREAVPVEEEVVLEEETVVKEEKTFPEKREEVSETDKVITIEKGILDTVIIEKIEGIAHKYLGDFSLDIVSNVIEDSELDRERPTKDQVLEVTNSLFNAASLIIGSTKASELEEDILKVIEEER